MLCRLPFLAIDDFAFRKGDRYGTIVCDLRTNKPLALLNGRDTKTVEDWLKTQTKLYVVARDGSNSYRAAITTASPDIVHVSDRFHLVQNLFKTAKDALSRLLPAYIELPEEQAHMIEPPIPTPLKPKEEERWVLIQEIKQAYQTGQSQREIARQFNMSRNTVKKYIEIKEPILYYRESKISTLIRPFYELVQERTESGVTVRAILKEIEGLGFKGSYSTVRKTVERLKSTKEPSIPLSKKVSRKKIILGFWRFYEQLKEKQHQMLQVTLSNYPETQPIYAFVQLVRVAYSTSDLQTFLQLLRYFEREETKEIKRYVTAIKEDLEAVKASFIYTFNTSIVEGQINRLKMLKRMMYGRASIELLEKRVRFNG